MNRRVSEPMVMRTIRRRASDRRVASSVEKGTECRARCGTQRKMPREPSSSCRCQISLGADVPIDLRASSS